MAAAPQHSSQSQAAPGILERLFKLSAHGTNVKTEILAGLTTFVTMAYIIIVNPLTLQIAGMDFKAQFTATILASAVGTLFMGLFANWPLALAPGMGMNAFFTFTLTKQMGLPWQTALGVVLISGLLFVVVSMTGLRKLLITAIPTTLKHAVGAGIGLFIMLIGFKNAGIIVANEATLVGLGSFKSAPVLLALFGLVLTGALMAKRVPGNILIGIAVTTLLGIPLGVTKLPTAIFSMPVAPPGFQVHYLTDALKVSLIPAIFALFFSDLFDTLGTFVGTAGKAGLMNEDGSLRGGDRALWAESVGTTVGALIGTSNIATYVESAAGIAAGGRTGLTAVSVGILFLICLFISPIALAVPAVATAPALIIVGVLMAQSFLKIDLNDFYEAFPAILTAVLMPFTFSIATGLALGFIAYTLLNLLTGRGARVHWLMYVLTVFFGYYFFTQH
jgi:AGZA family xanthine/uracil permease-like MFS transporter